VTAGRYWPTCRDRVRIVIEDEVASIYSSEQPGEFVTASGLHVNPADRAIVSIEKVKPPIPTAAQSAVFLNGFVWTLGHDFIWRATDGNTLTPELLDGRQDWVLLHDNGKGRPR
jgi:hypothetical protein